MKNWVTALLTMVHRCHHRRISEPKLIFQSGDGKIGETHTLCDIADNGRSVGQNNTVQANKEAGKPCATCIASLNYDVFIYMDISHSVK